MRVFISHAKRDRDVASRLAESLQADGISAWSDDLIEPGARWEDSLQKAVDDSDAFVVLISSATSDESPSIRSEWSQILKRVWGDEATVVLPVLLDGTDPPGFLRDHASVRMHADEQTLAGEVVRYLHDPQELGVRRTEEGQIRLDRRLAELEESAASLAEAAETGVAKPPDSRGLARAHPRAPRPDRATYRTPVESAADSTYAANR